VSELKRVIDEEPTYGVRRLTAMVRRSLGIPVNRKKVHRIVKLNGWQAVKRSKGKRPRVKGWVSRAQHPDQRWAVDVTHIFCGNDGWCHMPGVMDCSDRELVGWRLSKSGKAKVAAAALEDALRQRGITKRHKLDLRSDNGLVFGSKAFTEVTNKYGVGQEYITPYTPEQNGMIERFFRTLKEECIWQHRFESIDHAFEVIAEWIDKYNNTRPPLGAGLSQPKEYREKLAA
jgi:putative transposase